MTQKITTLFMGLFFISSASATEILTGYQTIPERIGVTVPSVVYNPMPKYDENYLDLQVKNLGETDIFDLEETYETFFKRGDFQNAAVHLIAAAYNGHPDMLDHIMVITEDRGIKKDNMLSVKFLERISEALFSYSKRLP